MIYNQKKKLWIGRDYLEGYRWYIGGFRDCEPYKRGPRDSVADRDRRDSHVTSTVAAGSNYSGSTAAANLTFNAIASYQGLQGGSEQADETNIVAQEDDGDNNAVQAGDASGSYTGLQDQEASDRALPLAGDDTSVSRRRSSDADRAPPRRGRGGSRGRVRSSNLSRAIRATSQANIPGRPAGLDQRQYTIELVRRMIRDITGQDAHGPLVENALDQTVWNIEAAAEAYLAYAEFVRARPQRPQAAGGAEAQRVSYEEDGEEQTGDGDGGDVDEDASDHGHETGTGAADGESDWKGKGREEGGNDENIRDGSDDQEESDDM